MSDPTVLLTMTIYIPRSAYFVGELLAGFWKIFDLHANRLGLTYREAASEPRVVFEHQCINNFDIYNPDAYLEEVGLWHFSFNLLGIGYGVKHLGVSNEAYIKIEESQCEVRFSLKWDTSFFELLERRYVEVGDLKLFVPIRYRRRKWNPVDIVEESVDMSESSLYGDFFYRRLVHDVMAYFWDFSSDYGADSTLFWGTRVHCPPVLDFIEG